LDYLDRAPFEFGGKLEKIRIAAEYLGFKAPEFR
jgi:hypothetical protein